MRQWLEQAVTSIRDGGRVNKDKLQALLGASSEQVEVMAGLTQQQRDFAKAFARLKYETGAVNKVARMQPLYIGRSFRRGPTSVCAVRAAGCRLIECEKTTTRAGRQAVCCAAHRQAPKRVYRASTKRDMEKSACCNNRKLNSQELSGDPCGTGSVRAHTKGLALEALAFHLAASGPRICTMADEKRQEPVVQSWTSSWRVPGSYSSRWQMQCKNSAQATLTMLPKRSALRR